ncbi:MAG: Hpt domain-containing protein [Anaerotignum faecicola]
MVFSIKANAEEFEVTAEEVNSLYRTMHSIKGSAAMMGYPAISETAHAAEDLFSYLRERNPRLRRRICSRFCSFCVWFPAF